MLCISRGMSLRNDLNFLVWNMGNGRMPTANASLGGLRDPVYFARGESEGRAENSVRGMEGY